jgi:hypothetical protein
MKRLVVSLVVALSVAVTAPTALASDATLKHALKPYISRLTTDIAYLASFTVPSKAKVGSVLHKVSKIGADLTAVTKAAKGQQASTKKGAQGRTLVLAGLRDATTANGLAKACAKAVKAGKKSLAKTDRKKEFATINKAIKEFESGGKDLHLF